MTLASRWDPCIAHTGAETQNFIREYFGKPERHILLVAGAGFDPRAQVVATQIGKANKNTRALLIKESRPSSTNEQIKRAESNTGDLHKAVANCELITIEIFGDDHAVVGGRNVVNALNAQTLDKITDVVIDISALSVGISYPAICYFVKQFGYRSNPYNLHIFVTHDSIIDAKIKPVSSDFPSYVHGFKGDLTLDEASGAAKLWLPQLSSGCRSALDKLYNFISPDDICPIVPFPAANPRIADELFEEYLPELESAWSVDAHNIVYANESDPLDLYRTILSLHDLRNPVFEEYGGSRLILSPFGSKVMALGALMAALERNLPVAYIEAEDYSLVSLPKAPLEDTNLIHVWLEGNAYPASRPPLILIS